MTGKLALSAMAEIKSVQTRNGYVPGHFTNRCHRCMQLFHGSKMSWSCAMCAGFTANMEDRHE